MKLPRTVATVTIVCVVEIVVLAAGFFIVMYSGTYDVAATEAHYATTEWVLGTTMDESVRHHAAGLAVSARYNSPDLAEGYERYHELCVTCHGAPGVAREEIGMGLNPSPPDLVQTANDWTPSEIYWMVKNGIKMSGMPAFGPTQDEEKLWNITAFVKRLPGMTPQQYRK